TPFVLGTLDDAGLATGLFLPVRELNHLRQRAASELMLRRDWAEQARAAERSAAVDSALEIEVDARAASGLTPIEPLDSAGFSLSAEVWTADDARAAAAAGATEVVFDPFLRHPLLPAARVRALAEELWSMGVGLRLRTPTIVRPEERRGLEKWLALELPLLTGHVGLLSEMASAGRDVIADYAVNCFNAHSATELFRIGARRITLSIELTLDEMRELTAPWRGRGFDVVLYGRPEGMTIEHCVLSAAFDREPTTCRDLCVQRHPEVEL